MNNVIVDAQFTLFIIICLYKRVTLLKLIIYHKNYFATFKFVFIKNKIRIIYYT